MRLTEWGERIRHSLWFVPTLCTLAAAVAALLLIWFSSATDASGDELPLLFGAGADGARAMLQAIAGSIITVAGVIFSITIVALQLTSTQFSPRVLRNFLSDRSTQLVLGVFVGTFTYALLVLRSIRGESDDAEAFVPAFAVSGAFVLTLLSVGVLIYFVHHISVRIQVTSILRTVAEETLDAVEHLAAWWEPDDDRPWQPAPTDTPATRPPSGVIPLELIGPEERLVPARRSGYLQLVDFGGLVTRAQEDGGRFRLLLAPGAWVQTAAPVATFTPSSSDVDLDALGDALDEALTLGHERSLQQDVAFGIQQLVDIAVKALSPSINDPTTAKNAIDRLVEVLVAIGANADTPRSFVDGEGRARLEIPFPTFDELVALAFDQIRHHGAGLPDVVVHLARGLRILHALPPHRHAPLNSQAERLAAGAASISVEADRDRALAAVRPLLR